MNTTTPRIIVSALALVVSSALAPLHASDTATTTKPNIVLIVTDDQGADSLGCYGNPVIKTPHIDKLASEGVRFTHCFSSASSCAPNRSVILTGLHHYANGMFGLQQYGFSSFPTVRSLPWFLAQKGYRTARVGKYHVAPESVYSFETVLPGNANNPIEMAERSRSVIAAGDRQPFFLYFCAATPHVGGGFATELPYKPDRHGNHPKGYPGETPVRYDAKDVIVPPYLPDIPETRAMLAQYYQAVSRADQGVGRLVEILKQAGQYERTIILFVSDNGHAMPMAKATLYDSGIRLPFIVRVPWQEKRGLVNQAMIGFTDLTPTILDWAGALPAKHTFHGRSFKAILEVESPPGWDEVYAAHTFHEITWYYPMRAVRDRRYKLIRNFAHELENPACRQSHPTWKAVVERGLTAYGKRPLADCIRRPEFELYDLEKDPDEVHNLAADPQHGEVFERLRKKLADFQRRTGDPWGRP